MSVYQSTYRYSLPPAAVRAYLAHRARELDCQRRAERRARREKIREIGCSLGCMALVLLFAVGVVWIAVLASGSN